MADAPLSMIRLALDQRRLMHLGRRTRLPSHQLDNGYLVHCALKELFGELAPHPFALPGEQQASGTTGRFLPVLGYTRGNREQLQEQAQLQASPDAYEICDWSTLACKPMPSSWTQGRRLSFELRACPIKRKNGAGEKHRAGAEVDVFLDRCWQVGEGVEVDRAKVYLEWLQAQFSGGGAALVQGELRRFQRQRLLRRDHQEQRTSRSVERPDAVFEGILEVVDPLRFGALLARGVGRHRAFGFGMLLVRPALAMLKGRLERSVRKLAASTFRRQQIVAKMIDRIKELFDADDGGGHPERGGANPGVSGLVHE